MGPVTVGRKPQNSDSTETFPLYKLVYQAFTHKPRKAPWRDPEIFTPAVKSSTTLHSSYVGWASIPGQTACKEHRKQQHCGSALESHTSLTQEDEDLMDFDVSYPAPTGSHKQQWET